MKNLIKYPLFWSLLVNVILLATVIILSVLKAKHECPTLDVTPYENKAIELQFKVKQYEKKLLLQNIIIDRYNNDELDSVWATIQR